MDGAGLFARRRAHHCARALPGERRARAPRAAPQARTDAALVESLSSLFSPRIPPPHTSLQAAHERAVAAGEEAAAAGDDEEEVDSDPLFRDSSLARLPGIFEAIRGAPYAGSAAAVAQSLPRKLQEALSHFGWK